MNTSPRPASGWLGLPPTLLISLDLAIVGLVFSLNIYVSTPEQCTSINIAAFLVMIACLVLVAVAMGQRGDRSCDAVVRSTPTAASA